MDDSISIFCIENHDQTEKMRIVTMTRDRSSRYNLF